MAANEPKGRGLFTVEIDGIQRGSFTTVSGLQGTNRIATYHEGNSRVPRKIVTGKVEFPNLVLEGGLIDAELYQWWAQTGRGQAQERTISVVQRGPDEQEVHRWNIYKAKPTVWRGPEFDASSEDVATERLEIAYEDLEMVR